MPGWEEIHQPDGARLNTSSFVLLTEHIIMITLSAAEYGEAPLMHSQPMASLSHFVHTWFAYCWYTLICLDVHNVVGRSFSVVEFVFSFFHVSSCAADGDNLQTGKNHDLMCFPLPNLCVIRLGLWLDEVHSWHYFLKLFLVLNLVSCKNFKNKINEQNQDFSTQNLN